MCISEFNIIFETKEKLHYDKYVINAWKNDGLK